MNSIDTTGKIKFTMSVANESVLEFLDFSLHINKQNKIYVDLYAKPTNSFTYVLPSTCYPKRNINSIHKGKGLDLGLYLEKYAIEMKILICIVMINKKQLNRILTCSRYKILYFIIFKRLQFTFIVQ